MKLATQKFFTTVSSGVSHGHTRSNGDHTGCFVIYETNIEYIYISKTKFPVRPINFSKGVFKHRCSLNFLHCIGELRDENLWFRHYYMISNFSGYHQLVHTGHGLQQLVLFTEKRRHEAFSNAHSSLHLNADETYKTVFKTYYWRGMKEWITQQVDQLINCICKRVVLLCRPAFYCTVAQCCC